MALTKQKSFEDGGGTCDRPSSDGPPSGFPPLPTTAMAVLVVPAPPLLPGGLAFSCCAPACSRTLRPDTGASRHAGAGKRELS